MPMTPLSTPPTRSDPSTFASRGDSFLASLPGFVTEANALEANVNAKEATASAAATTATTQAGNAATANTNAGIARDASVVARIAAEAAFDSFDDRYLGPKASAPTLDNDGAALLTGALYWDTALSSMRAYTGSAWVTLPAATAGAVGNTPAGTLSATNVQAAINELDADFTALRDAAIRTGSSISTKATITASGTLTTAQCGLLLVDATAGNITLTLPASGSTADDAVYEFRRIDSTANTVTVQRAGSDNVESVFNTTLPANSTTKMQLPSGATRWRVLGVSGQNPGFARLAIGAAALGDNTDLTSLTILPGYIFGCTMSTAGSSTTMTVAAGRVTNSTGVQSMGLLANTAKTTASWAVGTATGGLDTGAIANSTWYHFYVIRRPDTGVVDVLFSLSATAPTLPANYTQFRGIGSGLTTGSAQWTSFLQDGDEFSWAVQTSDIAATNPGTSGLLRALSVPPGKRVRAHLQIITTNSASSGAVYTVVTDPSGSDMFASATCTDLGTALNSAGGAGITAGRVSVFTNTSRQVRHRISYSDASVSTQINTLGWTDTRGGNA